MEENIELLLSHFNDMRIRLEEVSRQLSDIKDYQRAMNSPILDVRGVALLVNMSEQTIYNKANKGEMPCYKAGGLLRFKRSEIEKWALGRRRKTKQEIEEEAKKYVRTNEVNCPKSTAQL